jgi:holo-[acyl-carrier protein] synthase
MRIGIDMVEVERVGRIVARILPFLTAVYANDEVRRAMRLSGVRRAAFLAGRLAAKEATLKALGTGVQALAQLREIEVVDAGRGRPALRLSGSTAAFAASLGLSRVSVSISHGGGSALAVVVFQHGSEGA